VSSGVTLMTLHCTINYITIEETYLWDVENGEFPYTNTTTTSSNYFMESDALNVLSIETNIFGHGFCI
jgi:hypothetical protein